MAEQKIQGRQRGDPAGRSSRPACVDTPAGLVLGFGKFAQDQGVLLPPFTDPEWQFFLFRVNEELRCLFPKTLELRFHHQYDALPADPCFQVRGFAEIKAAVAEAVEIDPGTGRIFFRLGRDQGMQFSRRFPSLAGEMYELGKEIPGFYRYCLQLTA